MTEDFDPATIRTSHSTIHGTGLFAASALPAGHRVGVYEGRRYSARQASKRDWSDTLTYVFGLSNGSLIDGSEGGNATRHLNHSCTPNCVAYEESGPKRRKIIVIYTLHAIDAGQELFIDYSLNVDGDADADAFRCACGSTDCRGTMVSPLLAA